MTMKTENPRKHSHPSTNFGSIKDLNSQNLQTNKVYLRLLSGAATAPCLGEVQTLGLQEQLEDEKQDLGSGL